MPYREPTVPAITLTEADVIAAIKSPDFAGFTEAQVAALVAAGRRRQWKACEPQVYALMRAGWTFEMIREDSEPSQWYWRRPPRRKGRPGRLFLSTNQAYNAMMKEVR